MNKKPLVSIIIPTYNRAHLIGETLDSIVAQTYQNWECIVVDDGSTDATDTVMLKYCEKDARFKYFHRPEEHLPGGNGARNYGFKKSSGEYIQWLDSDDLIKPAKLGSQLNQLLNNSSISVCLCKAQLFNNRNKIIVKNSKSFSKLSFFEDYITRKLDMGTTQPLWRKGFLINKELYDENLKRGQDYDFLSRISSTSDFSFNYVDDFLVLIRLDEDNRITAAGYNSLNHRSLLISFLKVHDLVLLKNVKYSTYNDFINILISKIIISVKNNDHDTAITATELVIKSLDNTKYKFHFYRTLLIIYFLKTSKNRGFYRCKTLLFVN